MLTPRRFLDRILHSASGDNHRPLVDSTHESNLEGVYVVGDLAGAPVIKLAMEQSFKLIEHIASLSDGKSAPEGAYDVVIAGAGAAGLNAALQAQQRGLRYVCVEKDRVANTIVNFPEGKWVYAEPDSTPAKGKLWLDGATKEDLLARWHQIVDDNQLDVRTDEGLVGLERRPEGGWVVKTTNGTYVTRRVVLATGQRGNPRKLGVTGEESENIYHRLYSPKLYRDENILVIGGGNSAVEAALALAPANRVVLSYRGDGFSRLFKDNQRQLDDAVAAGRITVKLNSHVTAFGDGEASLQTDGQSESVPYQHAFVLIGAELPVKFLKSLGVKLENEWDGSSLAAAVTTFLVMAGLWLYGGHATLGSVDLSAQVAPAGGLALAVGALATLIAIGSRGNRFAWLGLSFLICHAVYGAKVGKGTELWPYRGWGYDALSLGGRPWSFWYTVLYTVLMTVFGLQAMKRWGIDRKDRFQIYRFTSLLAFQWIMFFLVPEYLFQSAMKHQWLGEALSNDPSFAGQAWRSYGLVYAWPLFFYTFFYDPHRIWVVWGVVLTLLVIPILVLFHGKRYCSWICGCGGLAETLGDRWRHLAPKGKNAIWWERMGTVVLGVAFVVTAGMLLRDTYAWLWGPAQKGLDAYRIIVDVWLVGILPVTLYPFLGGKVWCRFWCPLAKLMQFESKLFTRFKWSRFKIESNDKCIGCYECTRNCQVGIPVMQYALKQETLDNATSSCIGCGICVTVCPMDTLSFGDGAKSKTAVSPTADAT